MSSEHSGGGGFHAIVPAAGRGERSGRSGPKQYEKLLGLAVIRHAVAPLAGNSACRGVVVSVDPEWREVAAEALTGLDGISFVEGGERRQDSVLHALDSLPHDDRSIVLVHDAARPCLASWLVDRLWRTAERYGAAIPGVPVLDTIKQVDRQGRVLRTVPREEYRLIQTPQAFSLRLLREAYRTAGEEGWEVTDEAGLLERAGEEIVVVEGDRENIKVTLPEDFRMAEEILRRRSG